MSIYQSIINKKENLSVVGLGYVGLPLAVAFAKKVNVIGFDVNETKIKGYKENIDFTNEVGNEVLKKTTIEFTNDETKLKECKFHIIAVPTPIKGDKTPDLTPVIEASKVVGRNLVKNSIVVYESTVYPGVTEDVCIQILENESGLKCGEDFKIGYSPERINPGDKVHTLESIVKIVSGMDTETLEEIANIYELIIIAGVYRAKSIKVAEAAKVIENSQRDVNIAFMNELAMVFNKMDIDTKSVLDAASTKWNFMRFEPGLVGGHCIGVDPYYFTYKAEQLGYHSQIILSGRRINDDMSKYIVENIIKSLIKANKQIKNAKIAILGCTFKENCPDTRNSKVIDIINELKEYGIIPLVTDSIADKKEVKIEYDLELVNLEDLKDLDALILAVPHKEYSKLSIKDIDTLFNYKNDAYNEVAATSELNIDNKKKDKVLIDIKGILNKEKFESSNYIYWRL